MKIEVNIENKQSSRTLFKGYKSFLTGAVRFVLEKENFPKGAICDITFVERDEIRRLNREFRSKDAETDVLSFPNNDDFDEIGKGDLEKGKIILGDVIICPDYIFDQAKEFSNTFRGEICLMTIHSVLHLLGYDHIKKRDAEKMFPKQEEYYNEYMKKQEEN